MNQEQKFIPQQTNFDANLHGDLKQTENIDSHHDNAGNTHKKAFWTIGNVKEDENKWQSFEAEDKPMKDFWVMYDNMLQIFALQFALRLNIFEKLATFKEGVTAKELKDALSLKLPERRFEDLLDQLFVHGFLERQGLLDYAKYRISEYTAHFLLKDSSDSHYYTYQKFHELIKDYADAEKAIQTGKFKDSYSELLKSEEMMRIASCFQARAGKLNWDIMLDQIDFSKFKTVVNVAGQSGYLAKEFSTRYSNVEFINFDDKAWKKLQQETEQKCGAFPSNIKLEYGNPLDKIPEADCIIVPNVCVYLGVEDKKKLGESLYKALRPNGMLVILDSVTSENRDVDDCGLKQSFSTLCLGIEGFATSFKECQECLTKHGFKDVHQLAKLKGNNALIVATK